jgi:hypothetical protein
MSGHIGARLGLIAANTIEQFVVMLHILNWLRRLSPSLHDGALFLCIGNKNGISGVQTLVYLVLAHHHAVVYIIPNATDGLLDRSLKFRSELSELLLTSLHLNDLLLESGSVSPTLQQRRSSDINKCRANATWEDQPSSELQSLYCEFVFPS